MLLWAAATCDPLAENVGRWHEQCSIGILPVGGVGRGREYRLEADVTLGGGDVRSAGRKRQPMA
jgi:hypothetical protein